MSDYKCECNGKTIDKRNVTIRYIEGKGAVHDIKCEECGEYMTLANPKSGVAGFRANRYGQTY